jgi:alpha-glucan,water dikinase
VLIQEVVQADYAFVAHTVNPSSSDPNELYAEVVVGLGETLVGNYPGRALGAVCNKATREIRLLAYPGKSQALRGGGLIFRSDSNGEDLAEFAGAGLYESVVLPEPQASFVDYTSEPLAWDKAFRENHLRRITEAGVAIEQTTGVPQDIEGAISKGNFYVVQTRPQVGLPT